MLSRFKSKKIDESARLKAFLSTVPGHYCGFGSDGDILVSDGFLDLFALKSIRSVNDLQVGMPPSDAAALEGLFIRLQMEGKPFTYNVQMRDERMIRLSGARNKREQDNAPIYDVLWAEDIGYLLEEKETALKARRSAEAKYERYKAIINLLNEPMWIRDTEGQLHWVNLAYALAMQSDDTDILEQQRELSFSGTREQGGGRKTRLKNARELAMEALKDGQEKSLTTHIISGGQRKFVEIHEVILPDGSGTIGRAIDLSREEELEETLNRYLAANKDLLEQLNTSIAIFGADQRLEFYNTAFSRQWTLEENWLNAMPKLGEIMEKLRELRQLPEQTDFRTYKKTWLDMFTSLLGPHEDMLYLPSGAALRMLVIPHPMGGLMMTFEDVSSRLELETSYNTLVEVQKETLDNLAESVVVYGGDGRLQIWNPAFAKLWALNPEDLDGNPHISRIVEKKKTFFVTDEWDVMQEMLVAQGLERKEETGRLYLKDERMVDFVTVPLPDGGVLITFVDISDSLKVEKALREKNAALETAEKMKIDFLANVSYQLRTPLNAIMGFAEILEQKLFGDLNDKQVEHTQSIMEAGDRLLNLINDILDLSTLEAGYMAIDKETINVAGIIDHIHTLTHEWAIKQNVKLKKNCSKKVGNVMADQRRIKQVLLNLVQNAIAYTPAGGTVTLSCDLVEDFVVLRVKDTGKGISSDDQLRIFEPFERASDKQSYDRGVGLGLTLVQNIIALHGGRVEMDSVIDKGTTVSIYLPIE